MLKCCEQCGGLIPKETNRSRNSYAKKRFCSRQCNALAQSKKITLPCLGCGEPVARSPSHLKNGVYCSVACRSTRTTFTCEQCKATFTSRPVWRAGAHIFCGSKCAGIARRLNKPQSQGRRSPGDLAWKAAVFLRQGKQCQMCSSTRRLVVHHVQSIASSPHLRHDPTNGQVLCHDCHYYKVHGGAPNLIHGRYSKRLKKNHSPPAPP